MIMIYMMIMLYMMIMIYMIIMIMLTQVSPQWVHLNDGDDDKIIIKIMMIMMTGVSSMGANRGPLSRLPKH